jgi:hypothetical protein
MLRVEMPLASWEILLFMLTFVDPFLVDAGQVNDMIDEIDRQLEGQE